MTSHVANQHHHSNGERDRNRVCYQEFQRMHPHDARDNEYLHSDSNEMPTEQDNKDAPPFKSVFKVCEFFWR